MSEHVRTPPNLLSLEEEKGLAFDKFLAVPSVYNFLQEILRSPVQLFPKKICRILRYKSIKAWYSTS